MVRPPRFPSAAARLIEPLWSSWLVAMAPVVAMAAVTVLALGIRSITDIFFLEQDAGVLLLMTVLLRLLPFAPHRLAFPPWQRDRLTTFALAVLVALVAYGGVWLVCQNYPLSMDEFMARFDARIFRSGRLAGPIPPEWREYAPTLQPIFLLPVPGNAFWVSGYLPVNAAFQALGASLGSSQAVNPIWAGISVVAVYGVARQLWPDRPRMALTAAFLLATSSQFLIMAMTPYAMSAHLALNLVWLWLALKGGWRAHGLAAAVAFLACGLHQLVFNVLFAAPFVLQMWLDRRWRPALWHTAAYGAICLFWISYWAILFKVLGVHAAAAPGVIGGGGGSGALVSFFGEVLALARTSNFDAFPLMAENLIRFATWQSLLTVPLAMFAARHAIRSPGPLRSLLLGPILLLFVTLVLLPTQIHGWGYRYLHDFLGSACLLAAWGWDRLRRDVDETGRQPADAIFALALVASVLLLPIRAWQANRFIRPYAAAERAIQRTKADVVLVDDVGVAFGSDLVRNDPLFETGPIVLQLRWLEKEQIRHLCATHTVAVFSGVTALSYGIRPASSIPGAVKASDMLKAVPLSAREVCGS